MSLTRNALDRIINLVDYTNGQCRSTAMIGAALEVYEFRNARDALAAEPLESTERIALLVLLDQIDFTHDACTPFEMVGAVLSKNVIQLVRKALVDTTRLDATIETLRSDKGKRAKPTTTFQLQVFRDHAILQGARGKTVQEWTGPPDVTKPLAHAYITAIPGATYNSFWND